MGAKLKTDGKAKTALKILIGIETVAIPFLMWYLWLRMTGCDILQSHPTLSDELGYWRIMYSLSECGFDFGTCGGFINSPARWGHFGSHGLSPFLAWGGYALLFPWAQNSLVVANFIELTVAMAIFVLLAHDDIADMLFSAAVLLGSSYVFLYLCSSMMEIPCAAAVIIFAALFIRWRRTGKKLWLVLAIAQVIYLTFLRYCYAVVAFPLVWELCENKLSKKSFVILAAYGVLTLFIYFTEEMFMADYPENIMVLADKAGLLGKVKLFFENAAANTRKYFTCAEHQTSEFYQRMLFGVMIFSLCVYAAAKKSAMHLSLAIVLFGMMLMNIFFYDIGYQKEFRAMGPVMLFALIMTANTGEPGKSEHIFKTFAAIAAAVGLIVAVRQINGYLMRQEYNMFFMQNRFSPIENISEEVAKCFDSEPATAAIKTSESFETVVWIPPQIGVQWVFSGKELKDAQTDYIISIADDSIIPESYELVGEPANSYKIYKKTN